MSWQPGPGADRRLRTGLGGCVLEEGPGDPSTRKLAGLCASGDRVIPRGSAITQTLFGWNFCCVNLQPRRLSYEGRSALFKGDFISRQRSYSLGEPSGEVRRAEVESIRVSLLLAPLETPGSFLLNSKWSPSPTSLQLSPRPPPRPHRAS